jgi:hypothetical protein
MVTVQSELKHFYKSAAKSGDWPRNCLHLDMTNLIIFISKKWPENSLKITKFACYFSFSEKKSPSCEISHPKIFFKKKKRVKPSIKMWQIFLNFGRILGYRKAHDFSCFNINICDDDDYIYIYMAILLNPAQEKPWLEVSRGRSIYDIVYVVCFATDERSIICRLSCPLFAAFFCVFFPI